MEEVDIIYVGSEDYLDWLAFRQLFVNIIINDGE